MIDVFLLSETIIPMIVKIAFISIAAWSILACLFIFRSPSFGLVSVFISGLVIFAFLMFMYPMAFSHAMPVNKKTQMILPSVEEALVLHAYSIPNEKIIVLMQWEGMSTPRLFEYPWSDEMEKALREAMDQSEEATGNRQAIMLDPFGDSMLESGENSNVGETDQGEPSGNVTNERPHSSLGGERNIIPLPEMGRNVPKPRPQE